MQQKQFSQIATSRSLKIANIRSSLSKIPIISRNSLKIQLKLKIAKEDDNQSLATKNSQTGQEKTPISRVEIHQASFFEQKYRIDQKIGEGANGFVNKCTKLKSNKTYAVKSLMMDQQHILQLKQNFLSIKTLQSPYIIQYHSLYIDMRKKTCYLIMQYSPLPSLQQIHPHQPQQLKLITYQLLETVKYMHQHNVAHRDIKPENVLYDREKKMIKIIDFGTAKKFIRRHKRFEMLTITGTPFYRAPEMFTGGGYDQKVDVWSIGILLYKMITGKTPFESSYLSDTIHHIKENCPTFDQHVWQKYDTNLKNLIKRMLKKNPKQRLSAQEYLKDVWFYSLAFLRLTDLSQSYQQNQIKPSTMCRMIQGENRNPQSPQKKQLKSMQTLSYVIKTVDGEDYHLIDSQGENQVDLKSENRVAESLKQRKLSSSLIF